MGNGKHSEDSRGPSFIRFRIFLVNSSGLFGSEFLLEDLVEGDRTTNQSYRVVVQWHPVTRFCKTEYFDDHVFFFCGWPTGKLQIASLLSESEIKFKLQKEHRECVRQHYPRSAWALFDQLCSGRQRYYIWTFEYQGT